LLLFFFFFGTPPCYIIPPFDAWTHLGSKRASSWFRLLYFHSIITWTAVFFFSIVASTVVLMDHNTKGTRQGNIKHAPKTRPIALLSMTDVACIVPFTLGFQYHLPATSQTWGVYEPM
jgi:hypothetical protein